MATSIDGFLIKPRYTTTQAADFLGCASSTVKKSRVTGQLFGSPAPKFMKLNRRVVYTHADLEAWLDQFHTHRNTAEYGGAA